MQLSIMLLLLHRSVPRDEDGSAQKRSRSQDPGQAANGHADGGAAARKRQKDDAINLPPPPPAPATEVQPIWTICPLPSLYSAMRAPLHATHGDGHVKQKLRGDHS